MIATFFFFFFVNSGDKKKKICCAGRHSMQKQAQEHSRYWILTFVAYNCQLGYTGLTPS